ncbi:MAG: sensor histidine kinase [Enterocloster bolteae]
MTAIDTLELLVLFALQPLVENSIKYGISQKQGGKIRIRSWLEESGCGYQRGHRAWDGGRAAQEIREALKAGDDRSVSGAWQYGDFTVMYKDGGMFLYSRKGCGTVVQMAFGKPPRRRINGGRTSMEEEPQWRRTSMEENLNGENHYGEENPNGKDDMNRYATAGG